MNIFKYPMTTPSIEFISWHRVIDQRNLEMACATADCVRADPRKLEIAAANLQRLIDQGIGGGLRNRYIFRWKQIFDTSDADFILGELTRDDETGAALRQADPFTGILPAEHRNRIIEAYETRREGAQRIGAWIREQPASGSPGSSGPLRRERLSGARRT